MTFLLSHLSIAILRHCRLIVVDISVLSYILHLQYKSNAHLIVNVVLKLSSHFSFTTSKFKMATIMTLQVYQNEVREGVIRLQAEAKSEFEKEVFVIEILILVRLIY